MIYYILVIAAYILLGKLIFNTSANPAGKFHASAAAYFFAIVTIWFIIFINIKHIRTITTIPNKWIFKLPLLYYTYALFFSPLSLIPMVSLFRAISGIGFVIASISIGKSLSKYPLEKRIKTFSKILILILIVGIISNYLFQAVYLKIYSPLQLKAGYIGLICTYLSLWYLIDYYTKHKKKYLFLSLFLLFSASLLHSFSAYIAYYAAFIYLSFYLRKYLQAILLTAIPLYLLPIIIHYLKTHPYKIILGKPAAAYLIGSGRFEVYMAAIDAFINKLNEINKIFGVGFMAERDILASYHLTWSSDPHNSFLMSLLGLGLIGTLLYTGYIIAPFFYIKKLRKLYNENYVLKWIGMHIMFSIYGLTSSSYLATPSIQLILFLLFSYILLKGEKI